MEGRVRCLDRKLQERKKKIRQYLKVSATEPIFSGAYHAEKATITGT